MTDNMAVVVCISKPIKSRPLNKRPKQAARGQPLHRLRNYRTWRRGMEKLICENPFNLRHLRSKYMWTAFKKSEL